MILRMLNNDRE